MPLHFAHVRKRSERSVKNFAVSCLAFNVGYKTV